MANEENKACVECKRDLGRYWGRNFCKNCLGEMLNAQMREDDAREMRKMRQAVENS